MFTKIKHNITNTKFKKGIVKRTREYIESEDRNRKWEDDVMPRNMISTAVVSRLNTILASSYQILTRQREASFDLERLKMEYHSLTKE
jgi:hypothetical protein